MQTKAIEILKRELTYSKRREANAQSELDMMERHNNLTSPHFPIQQNTANQESYYQYRLNRVLGQVREEEQSQDPEYMTDTLIEVYKSFERRFKITQPTSADELILMVPDMGHLNNKQKIAADNFLMAFINLWTITQEIDDDPEMG